MLHYIYTQPHTNILCGFNLIVLYENTGNELETAIFITVGSGCTDVTMGS